MVITGRMLIPDSQCFRCCGCSPQMKQLVPMDYFGYRWYCLWAHCPYVLLQPKDIYNIRKIVHGLKLLLLSLSSTNYLQL